MRAKFKVGDRVSMAFGLDGQVEGRVTKVGTPWMIGQPHTRRYFVEYWNPLRMQWMNVEVYELWLRLA